jgi:hypothetical protein
MLETARTQEVKPPAQTVDQLGCLCDPCAVDGVLKCVIKLCMAEGVDFQHVDGVFLLGQRAGQVGGCAYCAASGRRWRMVGDNMQHTHNVDSNPQGSCQVIPILQPHLEKIQNAA